MKKNKVVSLLLSLSLAVSLAIPGSLAMPTYAASTEQMVVKKTATKDDEGDTYTIKLEAYATGEKIISSVNKDKPTDIILVLDQSGSMKNDIGKVNFQAYTRVNNDTLYGHRHNGGDNNLWHKLSDGRFVSVSVIKQEKAISPRPVTNGLNNSDRYGYTNLWNYRNRLFAKKDGKFMKVTVTEVSDYLDWRNTTYQYSLPDGTVIASDGKRNEAPEISGTDDNLLYTASFNDSETEYIYTYTDSHNNNATEIIGSSIGKNNSFTTTLYQLIQSNADVKRVDALRTAAKTFVTAVAEKAAGADKNVTTTDDNVNHRIAVVGFATGEADWGAYLNTKLLSIRRPNSSNLGVSYPEITNSDLQNVLQNMDKSNEANLVNTAIDGLKTEGATRVDLGLDMAERIFRENPVDSKDRNRVVIVFTDGSPTSSNGFEKQVATNAKTIADRIKNELDATVYSVGIFAGADANSAGNEPSRDLADGSSAIPEASNWFMQQISSNDGVPRNPSYYLSAGDAGTLNSIFEQIAGNIENGSVSTTLDEKAVVKDIISPYFKLPSGTTSEITLKTASYIGEGQWDAEEDAGDEVKAKIVNKEGNEEVQVDGFNFAANWCGKETTNGNSVYRGKKLIISFKVEPKSGFLGGNNVPTNAHAGVYENSTAEEPVTEFEKPEVNVGIKNINVNAPDKNVYLLGTVPGSELKSGTATIGGVPLELGEKNYGLSPWQYDYVTITVGIQDEKGNPIEGDLTGLKEDSNYTVSVTIKPTKNGNGADGTPVPKEGVSGSGRGNINVFKPELTFKDSEAYYGEKVTKDFSVNNAGETWKHGEGENVVADDAPGITMIGSKPDLTIGYMPNDEMLDVKAADDKYYTKKDVPVKATVSIGAVDVTESTGFLHKCESNNCDWTDPTTKGDPAFKIHIKTCQLTITKSGGAAGEPYVFTVKRNGDKYSEVTLAANGSATIYELPVGTYTIEEDTGWSWRYSPKYSVSVTLAASTPENQLAYTGEITCTNEKIKDKDKWLNGFSDVVTNILGKPHTKGGEN